MTMAAMLLSSLSAWGDPAPAVSYTAADYVRQDDLIAIWDGLERAPAGQKDPAVWKDLKRGLQIALVGDDCFGANYAELYGPHVYSGITEVVEDPTATYTLEASAAACAIPSSYNTSIASLSYRAGLNLDIRQSTSTLNISRPTNPSYPNVLTFAVYHPVNNAETKDILNFHSYSAAIGMSDSEIGPGGSSSVEATDGVTNSVGYNAYGTIGWNKNFYNDTWKSKPTTPCSLGISGLRRVRH